MEENRKDSLPEFDSKYIDQLFSAGRTSAKKEAPPPAPEQPEPVPAPPKAEELLPEEPKPTPVTSFGNRPKILLLLTAVVLLSIGFLLGRITAPDTDPGETLGGTDSPDIGTDYASMSTQELVDLAVQISGLPYHGYSGVTPLNPDTYNSFRYANPVLTELEQRPDAVEVLEAYLLTKPTTDPTYLSANALIYYYSIYLSSTPPVNVTPASTNEWIVQEDKYTVIYEYTTTPKISYLSSDAVSSSPVFTVLDFDGIQFALQGYEPLSSKTANFWFRVELKANAEQILAAQPAPRPTCSPAFTTYESWVKVHPYKNGWFVYGYTDRLTDISFSFDPQPTSSLLHQIALVAFPDYTGEITYNLAKHLYDHTALLAALSSNSGNRDLSLYPAVAELLRREDGISSLLKLCVPDSHVPALLSNSTFTDRMTKEEKDAMHIITQQSGYFSATPLGSAAVIETDNGNVLNGFEGFHVGPPSNLQNIPLSEMNCWIYVPLTEGARLLREGSWKLAANAGSTKLGSWILYDSSTNKSVGWIVAGKIEPGNNVWLQLRQASTPLEKQEVFPLLLEP